MAVLRGLGIVAGSVCFLAGQTIGLAQTAERCVLSGTVVNSTTSAGIAHALVAYNGGGSGFRFTDLSGSFQVADVPCGPYSLNVTKPGFMPPQQPAPPATLEGIAPPEEELVRRARPTFVTVDLKPKAAPAQIPMAPLGAIAGTVTDEHGEPLVGAAVQCIAVKASMDGAEYVAASTARTDDRGAYEFLELPPDDYVVRLVGEASSTRYFMGSRLSLSNDHRGVQPVYYPKADSPASASVLHVGPGERASADFRQPTEAAYDIDGRLGGLSPGAWTRIQLYRDGDRLPLGAAYVNLSSGQFRIVDVPRGSYTVRAVQYVADLGKYLAAEAQVTVNAQPIRDLLVELSRGVDIPVSVSYEAGAQSNGMLRVWLEAQHMRSVDRTLIVGTPPKRRGSQAPEAAAEPAPARVTDVIPGRYKLIVQPLANGDYVAAAKLGELDVLRGEFAIGGGPGELHITIRGDGAGVDGKVTFQGQPAVGAFVLLMPVKGGSGGTRSGFCDAEGSVHIAGVAPGDYRILAWSGYPTAADMLSGAGERVTLAPGEHRNVVLQAAKATGPATPLAGDVL